MWLSLILVGIICALVVLFFIIVKKYKRKIVSLEKKNHDKNQEIERLQNRKDHQDEMEDKLESKNVKLKNTFKDNERLIKGNQQLRNQLSELEEKYDLIQENKRKLQKDREKLRQKLEKTEEKCSHLNRQIGELKSNFLNNEKIKSYQTILKEALILQTFLHDDTRRYIQILHDFSEVSEETIREYLSHLCNLNLLNQVEDDTYQRNFSLEQKDEHMLDRLICKIFDCDLQKFRGYLK